MAMAQESLTPVTTDPSPFEFAQVAFNPQAETVNILGSVYTPQRDAHIHFTSIYHTPDPGPAASASFETRKLAVLGLIPTNNFRAYHTSICDQRVIGTGEKFKQDNALVGWLETRLARLWCMGGPGTGKTYLASAIIDLLEEMAREDPKIVVAFAYMQFSAQLSTWDVVAALIRQLVTQTTSESVLALVDEAYKQHRQMDSRPPLSQMVKLLHNIVKECGDPIISFDGLDEMLPDRQREVLEIAMSLEAKVIIFSRYLPLLKTWLEKLESSRPTAYLDIEASSEDLNIYINYVIDKTPGCRELLEQGDIVEKVTTTVNEMAGGMFLHAALHLEVIRSCTSPQAVLDEMARFPADIQDLYASTMDRIGKELVERCNLAKRAITWLLHVRGRS